MLHQISSRLADLSKTESRVALWILEHPRKAAEATLAEVAGASDASEPSVVRFCRKVGLGGFRELTLRLTETLSRPDSYVHQSIESGDDSNVVAGKVVDFAIQSLMDLRTQLPFLPLELAVKAMSGARQIAFAGLGASGRVASDAHHKFFRLGIPCSVITDSPTLLQFSAIAEPDDVLVVCSNSGGWPELQSAATTARSRGAIVIAITMPDTALADSANIALCCKVPEDTSVYTPMTSRLAHLALLDVLQVSMALTLGDKAATRLRDSKNAIRSIPLPDAQNS